MVDSEASKMNLAALRKVDSTISSIVDIANQVALYKFIAEANKWEKIEIEGTLFVYMRSQKPQHGFMVMNRLNTTNLVEPITNNLDFKDETPFLMYRNGKGHIYGIWFYEQANCAKIFKLLTSLSQLTLTKNDSSSNIRQRSYSESNRKHQKERAQADILSLLTRAQDEYDKKSAKGSNKASKQHSSNNDIVKPTPLRMNGAVTISSDTTPLTLGMLFAQAGGVQRKPEETSHDFDTRTRSFTASASSELLKGSGKSTEAILQSLLSNSAHTVQHIEQIQKEEDSKCIKNQLSSEARAMSAGERMLSMESVEKDLKEKLNILPKVENEIEEKASLKEKMVDILKSKPIDIPVLTPAMIESFSSAPTGFAASRLENVDINSCNNYSTSFQKRDTRSFSPNQLLSPMDFTTPCRKKNIQTATLPSSCSPELGTSFIKDALLQGNSGEDLLHPQSLLNGSLGVNQQSSICNKPSVTPLNKDQLREALIYMLQNDEDFVLQLHDCYVKRLKSQLTFVNKS